MVGSSRQLCKSGTYVRSTSIKNKIICSKCIWTIFEQVRMPLGWLDARTLRWNWKCNFEGMEIFSFKHWMFDHLLQNRLMLIYILLNKEQDDLFKLYLNFWTNLNAFRMIRTKDFQDLNVRSHIQNAVIPFKIVLIVYFQI